MQCHIDELLAMALERAALCSNDPFCASHDPNSELEKRYAHGAACHGCLLIAETSCERRNEFLDLFPLMEKRLSVTLKLWWPIKNCSSPAQT